MVALFAVLEMVGTERVVSVSDSSRSATYGGRRPSASTSPGGGSAPLLCPHVFETAAPMQSGHSVEYNGEKSGGNDPVCAYRGKVRSYPGTGPAEDRFLEFPTERARHLHVFKPVPHPEQSGAWKFGLLQGHETAGNGLCRASAASW